MTSAESNSTDQARDLLLTDSHLPPAQQQGGVPHIPGPVLKASKESCV